MRKVGEGGSGPLGPHFSCPSAHKTPCNISKLERPVCGENKLCFLLVPQFMYMYIAPFCLMQCYFSQLESHKNVLRRPKEEHAHVQALI